MLHRITEHVHKHYVSQIHQTEKQNKNRAQDLSFKIEMVFGSLSRCERLRLMAGTELVSPRAEEHLVARIQARTGEPGAPTKRLSDQPTSCLSIPLFPLWQRQR